MSFLSAPRNVSFARAAARLAVLMASLGPALQAADVIKANNTDDMVQGSSWIGGLAPDATGVAVFDSTLVDIPLDATYDLRFMPLNSSVTWGGIKIANNGPKLALDTFFGGLSSVVVTLGSSGIDASAATPGNTFTFDSPTIAVPAATSQTWSVADGAILHFKGPLARGTGATLNFGLGTTGTGQFLLTDTSFGAANALNAYATVEKSDFMALTGGRVVAPGASVLTYTPNPVTDTTNTNPNLGAGGYSVIDVVNSNTTNVGATALRTTGNWDVGGIRFATAHATGLDWTVDTTTTTRNINIGNGGILVGPAVGAHNVVFTGSSFLRLNNTGGQDLFLHQHNPAGDLVIGVTINGGSLNHRLVKDGVGRVILGGSSDLSAATIISEGTLQIGNGGTTGWVNSPVTNHGVLAFNRSNELVFDKVISGPGRVDNLGSGTLTLSGANTFTGAVRLGAGKLAFTTTENLGAGTALEFSGGTLQWAPSNTLDVSSRTLTFNSGGAGFDTNGNDITFSNSVGNGGAGGLSKIGAGTLTLASANNYSGATTVSGGVLNLANIGGSSTGSGAVTVAAGGTLAGTGSSSGTVSVASSGKLAPGSSGIGTLTVGGLSLESGSLLDLEFSSTSSNDRVVVTSPGGLSIGGGSVNVYAPGGTTAYASPGTYNLFQYSGAIAGTGPSAMSVLNPQAGYSYSFGTASGNVTLTINQLGMITQWTSTGSGSFATAGNWSNGVPAGISATANFSTSLPAGATVTLDGTRTLGGLSFNSSPGGYTIAQGTGGNLILDNGSSDIAVNVLAGDHFITAPIALTGNLAVSTSTGSSLAITGPVGGTGNVVKSGPGTFVLGASNAITGSTTVAGGALEFGSLSSIGNGSITLNGGALRYGTGNTADISARTVTIGVNGGTIDTNGNDVTFAAGVGNAGTGGFTKAGAGVLTLSAASNYTGTTTITGGSIKIGSDAFLNASPTGISLNGGTLETSATIATARVITSASGGGGIKVAPATTLTVNSALTGSGQLTKSGAGTLVLTALHNLFSGGIRLSEGVLTISNSAAAGTGALTMLNGTTLNIGNSATFITAPVTVSGTNANVNFSTANATGGYSSLVTGTSDQSLTITGATAVNFSSNTKQLQNFAGTVNVPSGTFLAFRASALNNGGDTTTFNINGGLSTRNNGNVALGALTGSGSVGSGTSGSANTTLTYTIGAKNADATFSGVIQNGDIATGKLVAVTKVGTGAQTLSGVNTYTGATNVNAGILRVNGSLAASATTVAAAGTLAGSGTLGGNVTINNGTLSLEAPAAGNAQLTVTGSLALSGAATPVSSTTQFDFAGATFTGVKANGGVAYAGALKLNFTGSLYNGSYTLFQVTGTPAGAFSAMSATRTVTSSSVTFSESAGVWTGVLDGATLTFTPATGVLSVSNGLGTPSAPGVSTLGATAGNATVNLSWTAASGADTYIVKRATISGGPYTNVVSNLAGTTYSDTTVTNGTTYYYVVQARNTSSGLVGSNSNEVSASPVAAPTYTSLQTWRFDQFGVYEDTGAVLAGNTEDFDGDGLANILEYALNTNPKVANASPVVVGKSGNNLTLTYPRRATADAALTYAVQASSDLIGGFTAAGGATNTVGSTSTYTDNVDVSAAGVRRFLRLSVTYTAP